MDGKIRQADRNDIEGLSELYKKIGHKDENYFEKCLEEQENGKRVVFLYENAEKALCGYVILNWTPGYPLYRKLGIPEIQDLNVIPECRRLGMATALIMHCEGTAREKGCETIGISVGLFSDYGPAQRLYVKLGYMPDGNGITYDRETVGYGEIRPVDDDLCLMMIKVL